ncbi:MAG: hypothetical protein V1837_02700 [Candidatus Woesearchaeota archaeon]
MRISGLHDAVVIAIILALCISIVSSVTSAVPTGPNQVKNLSTSTRTSGLSPKARGFDQRGTINTVLLNLTQQSSKWKAYIGNITGRISLDDADNYTIYDWTMGVVSGEVYATRSSTTVNWNNIRCAKIPDVETEQAALKQSALSSDCINRTFLDITHPAFYAGPTYISNSICNKSANLYRNDVANAFTWHEVLLHDGTNIVYTAIINATRQGYNPNKYHDFQMLVAENGSEGVPTVNTYYFYVELT